MDAMRNGNAIRQQNLTDCCRQHEYIVKACNRSPQIRNYLLDHYENVPFLQISVYSLSKTIVLGNTAITVDILNTITYN